VNARTIFQATKAEMQAELLCRKIAETEKEIATLRGTLKNMEAAQMRRMSEYNNQLHIIGKDMAHVG
jgi:hypothetical protein